MSLRIERTEYDPETGYLYYVFFNPHWELEADEVKQRVPLEVAVSLTETGELADVTFTLPKPCRNEQALSFIHRDQTVGMVNERIFVAVPGQSGDSVMKALGALDLDVAGRIVGMEIKCGIPGPQQLDRAKAN
ncbi:hypothetical protein Acid345_2889 [Candidatus Koribacter versatilis Ellin345]|uniref:DUF2283 domain-containing protein n=1 Tax=Koribacter versatilis (strain Ellin345) TaxID=204669 RepID=Q1IML0_KORVE|nr:hypothetical protein [Candidatus Koribacter versatilis]ABF41890.1 hypothetical protein Acid345_2889 [Candidatus Koribacter versatilis Ellin345]